MCFCLCFCVCLSLSSLMASSFQRCLKCRSWHDMILGSFEGPGLEMLKWWRTDRQTNRISAWRLGGVTIDLASNCYNMLHNMFSHYGKVAQFPILATCQGKWLTMPMQIFIFHIFPTVGEKLDIWEEVWGKGYLLIYFHNWLFIVPKYA